MYHPQAGIAATRGSLVALCVIGMRGHLNDSSIDRKRATTERRAAKRFDLQMPIRYRRLQDTTWREAKIENIGKGGIYFRGKHVLAVDTPIEVVLSFPAELGGEPGATTTCRGRIARVDTPLLSRRGGCAATIDSYLMAHGDLRRI